MYREQKPARVFDADRELCVKSLEAFAIQADLLVSKCLAANSEQLKRETTSLSGAKSKPASNFDAQNEYRVTAGSLRCLQ